MNIEVLKDPAQRGIISDIINLIDNVGMMDPDDIIIDMYELKAAGAADVLTDILLSTDPEGGVNYGI